MRGKTCEEAKLNQRETERKVSKFEELPRCNEAMSQLSSMSVYMI